MNTITTINPQPRQIAKPEETDDLQDSLDAKKINTTSCALLGLLSLALCAWLLFFVMVARGVDFSRDAIFCVSTNSDTPLHQLTQQLVQQEITRHYGLIK